MTTRAAAFVGHAAAFRTNFLRCHQSEQATSTRQLPGMARSAKRRMARAELGKDENVEQNVPVETTLIPELEALDEESGSVIIRPSFNLAGAFLFTGGLWTYLGERWLIPGIPVVLLGVLFAVQSVRVRFVFGPRKFSVAQQTGKGLEIIRGWAYDGIVNWEFWWKGLPVLTYFKEKESYAGRGSVHFFPVVCDGKGLLEELKRRTPHLEKAEY